MTIIVEDGSGNPDAEAYCDTAFADAYHAKRGNSDWATKTLSEKESALVRATDYMQEAYHGKWRGQRRVVTQNLDWPRTGVVIDDSDSMGYYQPLIDYYIVPADVKNACAELALRATIGALNADQTRAVSQETVGPITVKYEDGSVAGTTYKSVNMRLAKFFKTGSGSAMVKLTRV